MPPDHEREKLVEEMLDAYFRAIGWRQHGESTSHDLRIDMACALAVAEVAFARREAAIRADEREACAKVAHARLNLNEGDSYWQGYLQARLDIAAAIRARGDSDAE